MDKYLCGPYRKIFFLESLFRQIYIKNDLKIEVMSHLEEKGFYGENFSTETAENQNFNNTLEQ